jgi:hypothetical protein
MEELQRKIQEEALQVYLYTYLINYSSLEHKNTGREGMGSMEQ